MSEHITLPDGSTTDPYGHIAWSVGYSDDFWCFDHLDLGDGRIALHAVINSETGSFIMDGSYTVVRNQDAVAEAERIANLAMEWCHDNKLPRTVGNVGNWIKNVAEVVGDDWEPGETWREYYDDFGGGE